MPRERETERLSSCLMTTGMWSLFVARIRIGKLRSWIIHRKQRLSTESNSKVATNYFPYIRRVVSVPNAAFPPFVWLDAIMKHER